MELTTRSLMSRLKARLLKTVMPNRGRVADPSRPDEARIAFEVVRRGSRTKIMIDVGAHGGESLEPFAQSGWQVFAFEPDSVNRRVLLAAVGGLLNVVIDARAVSDRIQQGVALYRSEQSTGISGLSQFHSSHQFGETVDVTTLESFFNEKGIAHQDVDVLKIDTEGFDLFVLKGFPWGTGAPRLILCEFEDSKTVPLGYTFHDLAAFLRGHGYKLIVSEWYPIQKYGQSHDWRRFATYPCELQDPMGWGNIFAIKDDVLYDRLRRNCRIER